MKRLTIGAAAAALAALAAPAAAQLAPSYSGHSGIRYMGNEETWWTIRQLGDCLARTRQRAALALLATRPGTAEEAAASRALLGNNTSCLRHAARLTVGRDIIRGAVAEGLYRSQVSAPPPPEPLDEKAAAAGPPLPLLADFGQCFAQVRPNEVHSLLTTTRLGTRDEHAALVALAPELGQCFPAGLTISFPAPIVRLALAEAIFHRARAAAAPRQQRDR